MPSPSSCTRCSKLAALVSPSGLCPSCAATDETAATPANAPIVPEEAIPTGSVPPSPAPDSTASAELTGSTTGPHGAGRPLPASPAGYELVRRLGGGGMGEVYLAVEQVSERPVAMKFLRHPGRPEAFERFARELKVLANLDHPNIVRVLASDFLRADPFFTMEYVPGGTLSRATPGPVEAQEAVRIVRAVAGAVAEAHAHQVIHRDLKPSNILLADDGTPKVADFGLAKRLDEADPLTIASGALGTPGYMPPEQISRKNGEVDTWSDVYGLGATLYHLLTGRAPFVGETPQEVLSHVLSDVPERPRALCAEVPAALEGIVVKCLEKDPKDRYQTVAELVADLDKFTENKGGLSAKPLTPWRRTKRWAARNRLRLATATAVILLAGVMVWIGRAAAPVPKRPAPPPEPPDPLAELEKELGADRPVGLIVAADPPRPPRWKEWLIGGAELGPSGCWRTAIGFETNRTGLLCLARDPIATRYRLECALSHDRRGPATSGVGIFVGYERYVGANGEIVHRFLSAEFTEFWSEPELVLPETQKGHAVEVYDTVVVWRQDGAFAMPSRHKVPVIHRFVPANVPCTARGLAADVTPAGVVFSWREPKDWTEFAALGADQLRAMRNTCQADLDAAAPNSGVLLQDWNPRRPLGVCVTTGTVSLRTVTLTPRNP